MTTPFSTHFDMSKTANDIAHEMKIEALASWIPENDSEEISFRRGPQPEQ